MEGGSSIVSAAFGDSSPVRLTSSECRAAGLAALTLTSPSIRYADIHSNRVSTPRSARPLLPATSPRAKSPLSRASRTLVVEALGGTTCPTCCAPLQWSDFAGGPYKDGWSCNNFKLCGHTARNEGPWRWFCKPCQSDFCNRCHRGLMQRGRQVDVIKTPKADACTNVDVVKTPKADSCTNGHQLQSYRSYGNGVCDGCSKTVVEGESVMDCRQCNYYLCDTCLPHSPQSDYEQQRQQLIEKLDAARQEHQEFIVLQGRNVKELSPQTEATRRRVAEKSRLRKQSQERFLEERSREYYAAISNAGSQGRDSKALSNEVEADRKRMAEERSRRRLISSRQLEDANMSFYSQVAESGAQGRDSKCLSPSTEAARLKAAEEAEKRRISTRNALEERNRNYQRSIAEAGSQGRDKKMLSEEIEALRQYKEQERVRDRTLRQKTLSDANRECEEQAKSITLHEKRLAAAVRAAEIELKSLENNQLMRQMELEDQRRVTRNAAIRDFS